MDKNAKVHYIFTGPSPAKDAQAAEEHAVFFLLEAISNKGLEEVKMLIATDLPS